MGETSCQSNPQLDQLLHSAIDPVIGGTVMLTVSTHQTDRTRAEPLFVSIKLPVITPSPRGALLAGWNWAPEVGWPMLTGGAANSLLLRVGLMRMVWWVTGALPCPPEYPAVKGGMDQG